MPDFIVKFMVFLKQIFFISKHSKYFQSFSNCKNEVVTLEIF